MAAELGGDAFGVGVDVTDNAAFTAFLDGVEHRLGPLDVLVNNAGIMNAGPIDTEDEAMTARAIAINLEAVIHGTREAVRRMKPRRTGHIVNVSSAVSKVAGSHCATYVATKFGVAGFSEAVAIELRGTGVEMSVVRPSLCNTDLASGFAGLRGMPFIEPEDVAARIVETLQRPRFDVPVPKSMGPMLWLNQALPFRARHGAGAPHEGRRPSSARIDADEARRLRRAREGQRMIARTTYRNAPTQTIDVGGTRVRLSPARARYGRAGDLPAPPRARSWTTGTRGSSTASPPSTG